MPNIRIHEDSRPERGFAQIGNDALRDKDLSYEARGILAELLSRPDGWYSSGDEIYRRAKRQRGRRGESKARVYRALQELEDAGYLYRVLPMPGPRSRHAAPGRVRSRNDDRGRLKSEWHLYHVRVARSVFEMLREGYGAGRAAGQTVSRDSGKRSDQAEPESPQVAPVAGIPGAGKPGAGIPGAGKRGSSKKTETEDLPTNTGPENHHHQDIPVVLQSEVQVESSANGEVKTGDLINGGRAEGISRHEQIAALEQWIREHPESAGEGGAELARSGAPTSTVPETSSDA